MQHNNNNNNNNNLFSFILHVSHNFGYSVVNLVEKWNNHKAVCLFPVGIGFPMTSLYRYNSFVYVFYLIVIPMIFLSFSNVKILKEKIWLQDTANTN